MSTSIIKRTVLVACAIAICFLIACGKSPKTISASSTNSGGNHSEGPTSSVCYMGTNSDGNACVGVDAINAKELGYKNPYADPTFPADANKEQYRIPVQAIDLHKINFDLDIAPNFKIGEFMSLEKGAFAIFSPKVLTIVQKLREIASSPIRINSGFRPPFYNQNIDGAAKWSRHQYGDAVDIASDKLSLDQLVQLCRQLGATYVDKYVVHVHCDWRNITLEPQFFGSSANISEFNKSVEEERSAIIKSVYNSSQIIIRGQLKVGHKITLLSHVGYKEDTEDLYKKWVVIAPNGKQYEYESQELTLQLMKGTYQIVHDIGENIRLNKSFIVN